MSTTFRPERASEAIHEAAATILLGEVSDPRLQHVTLTRCEVTHDLSYAKIYYTVLGDEAAREDAERGFQSATSFLRSRVGQEVPLRTVPELSFRYDKGEDNAKRIDDILSTLPELKKSSDE